MMPSLINVEKITFCSIVTCIFSIVGILSTVRAQNGNPIKFAPLPKATEYNLHASNTGDNGLLDIAYGIANILRDKPPYDIINNVLTSKSITTNQIVDYEAPIIGLVAISLVFAIAIPIVGIVVCICRYAGKCGGDMETNKDLDIRPTKKRKRFTLAIVLCCVFLVSGSIIILVSSDGMTSSLQKTRKTVHFAFDDIFIYKNNTFQELNHILGSEVLQVLSNIIMNQVVKLGTAIVSPILDKGKPYVNSLVNSINKLDTALNASLHLLRDIDSNVQELVTEAKDIQEKLVEAKNNITSAKRNCAVPACDQIPDGNVLNNDANFTQVPNITETTAKVQDVVKSNLTNEANKGKASFENLPNTVQDLAINFTSDVKNFSQNVQDIKIDVLKPWEDKINEMLNKTLLPYKNEIDGYLKPDSNLIRYDNYRNIIYIVSSVMVLLVVLLTLLGLILGMVGASTFDTPSTRGDLSDIGGRILIGSAGFAVFTAFFINLVVAAVFLVGVNTAIVCRATPNYELLKNTVDSPEVMDVFSLSKLIFDKNQSQDSLTFTNLLTDCGKSQAMWTAMHLDQSLYNLSSALNYKDKIPKVDTAFQEINETVSNTSVMTTKAKQSVNDSYNAGVQNINFTKYDEQTNKPIVKVSLSAFADNITKAANGTPQDVKMKLEGIAHALMNLDNTTVKSSKSKSDKVKRDVKKLINETKNIVSAVKEIPEGLDKLEKFLKTKGVALALEGIETHATVILEDVDRLVTHVISQVRNDVGRCQPVNNIYQSLTTAVCRDYFGNLNISWIGFGICTLFTLITIILCVRAAKHFRRIHMSDTIKESEKWDSKIEMPWDAGFEIKDQLIN